MPELTVNKNGQTIRPMIDNALPVDPSGQTDLHRGASSGSLAHFPEELLNSYELTRQDKAGQTPLHIAAKNGSLSELSTIHLSEDLLLNKNGQGQTVLQVATESGVQLQTNFKAQMVQKSVNAHLDKAISRIQQAQTAAKSTANSITKTAGREL